MEIARGHVERSGDDRERRPVASGAGVLLRTLSTTEVPAGVAPVHAPIHDAAPAASNTDDSTSTPPRTA
jgi:hypothetical protein